VARAHLLIDGECVIKTGAGTGIAMKAGEIAFLPRGDAHLIGSALDAEARSLSTLMKTPIPGELVPVHVGGDGAATRWIVISSSCERHLADPLLCALPDVMRVDLHNAPALYWLTDALGLTLSASAAPPVGAAAEHSRLAELVLIEAISRHVCALPQGGSGWLAGLNDRFVGRALALVHGRPSEPWTVERLGRQVGLSRSALAERFVLVMGEPIFAYLTRWRLQVAAESLLTTTGAIESIAHEAGYESAGAFSAAFKRAFGKPPSIWRKRRRARAA
jgi:AraC-like DNA-binding protein